MPFYLEIRRHHYPYKHFDFYSRGEIDPRPIVAATVGLSKSSEVLSGKKIEGAGVGPKVHIDPRIM